MHQYLKEKDRSEAICEPAEAARNALAEWKNAIAYFESVKDPELVDYAAFCIETARRKYVYLLKHGGGR